MNGNVPGRQRSHELSHEDARVVLGRLRTGGFGKTADSVPSVRIPLSPPTQLANQFLRRSRHLYKPAVRKDFPVQSPYSAIRCKADSGSLAPFFSEALYFGGEVRNFSSCKNKHLARACPGGFRIPLGAARRFVKRDGSEAKTVVCEAFGNFLLSAPEHADKFGFWRRMGRRCNLGANCMLVLSLNIRSGGGDRVCALHDWISTKAPDVVVLSEWRNNRSGDTMRAALQWQGFVVNTAGRPESGANGLLIAAPLVHDAADDATIIAQGRVGDGRLGVWRSRPCGLFSPTERQGAVLRAVSD
jgi:hypothetical protein